MNDALALSTELTRAADLLRYHGYFVVDPDLDADELPPCELCARFDLSPTALNKRLKHPKCPASIRRRGPTGRLLTVGLTADLAAFLAQPKQPGKALHA